MNIEGALYFCTFFMARAPRSCTPSAPVDATLHAMERIDLAPARQKSLLIFLACSFSPASGHCQACLRTHHDVHVVIRATQLLSRGLEALPEMAGMARAAQGVVNSIVVQPVFAGERAVCYRERAAGMYAVLPFSLSLVRAQPHSFFGNVCLV